MDRGGDAKSIDFHKDTTKVPESPPPPAPSNQSNVSKKKVTKSKFDDPMMDPTWLYNRLQKEINHEATYRLENDAKLRAVEQGTANYEQFRQMVLGAHIRPLEKRDKMEGCQNGKRPYVVWNSVTKSKEENSTIVNEKGLEQEPNIFSNQK